jgi:alcohol dehydrogenase YqhD (iron-dependent ADH family)
LLGGVVPNPRTDLVYEGIKLVKEHNLDYILAIGGGSVIDSAKAISMGSCINEDFWEYFYIDRNMPEKVIPLSTIITIPAAGSESSNSAVIMNEKEGRKLGFNSDLIRPVLSIINPLFFVTIPRKDAFAGICDMCAHIFERYFTLTKNNDVVDEMSEGILRAIMKNALIIKDDFSNYEAWSELGLASTLAHNGLLGLGRAQDWASHKIEHELSAKYDISHGVGLAIVFPAWMKYVYKSDIDVFVNFSTGVMGIKIENKNKEEIVKEGIEKYENFLKNIELPTRLSELNIGERDLEELSLKASNKYYGKERSLGNFRKLYTEDIYNILKLAL